MREPVVIAGAGMGGLSASIALGLRGQQSLLCERTPVFEELGAGIQLGPNATRILESWGLLGALMDVASSPTHLEVFHGDQQRPLATMELGAHFKRRYAAPYLTIHRADLQTCLVQRLKSIGQTDLRMGRVLIDVQSQSDGVDIEWGAQESNQSHTQIENTPLHAPPTSTASSVTHARALIGADGVSSQVRRICWPERHLLASPHLAYRTTLAQRLLPLKLRHNSVRVYLGSGVHWVQYPVRAGEWLNMVALIEVPSSRALLESSRVEPLYQTWQEDIPWQTTREHFKSALTGAHANLKDLFQAVEGWSAWRLFDADPLRGPHQMVQGSVALLGDAAHPMLPFLAQGAGMSIEDAHSMAKFWCYQDQSVSERLGAYAQERWQRNARVQSRARANARIFHATGWTATARDLGLRVLGQRLLDMPWLYGYSS